MSTQESLSLPDRFELTHPSLPHPGRFMRLLGPVILILLITMDRVWHQFSMRHAITAQFVRHNLPWLSATGSHQPPEEALCCCTITLGL